MLINYINNIITLFETENVVTVIRLISSLIQIILIYSITKIENTEEMIK